MYQEKNKYSKFLTFVKMYGNSNCRYVELRDQEGNILTWKTNDYNNTYKNFRTKANYNFRVSNIINDTIFINYLSLA